MNGRVYDYNLGRFMSVDPLIQSPTSTQSVNPYSYIMNNPLAGTDPTGYAADYIAGASFGFNADLTAAQVELLNNADSCSYCTGEFAVGVNLGSDLKWAYKDTGSLAASVILLGKATLSALPNSGADNRINTDTGSMADVGSLGSSNTDQSMVDHLVDGRVNADKTDIGNATFSQGRDGEGNLTPVRQSVSRQPVFSDIHAEEQTLKDLRGKPRPWTVAVDQNPCDSCSDKLSQANVEKVVVPMNPDKPQNKSKGVAMKAAAGKGIAVPKVVRVSGRLDSLKLDKLDKRKR
ncbi:RHS repeat-associated core domain-containing protein [Shewanella mesophila]|uniref:RHS repeat-associated core domain-containing protein n=1 Tax=Shewanella mesophila TaxID=2864208 RepID=UPI0021ABCF1D|nr:RHS repeat-associated core domain-containing protein [Shewanella mesophila]